jgi:hypothetical protein
MSDNPTSPRQHEESPEELPKDGEQRLFVGGVSEFPLAVMIPRLMEHLGRVGMSADRRKETGPLAEPPEPGDALPVVLDNGEKVWAKFDYPENEAILPRVELAIVPLRTDVAILAALAAFEGTEADEAALSRISRATRGESVALTPEEGKLLRLADALLTEYLKGFGDMPEESRAKLRASACELISEVVRASRRLAAFLEYGSADRKLVPGARDPGTDLAAAWAKDVGGRKYREIAQALGYEQTGRNERKGGYRGPEDAVKRGRRMLDRGMGGRFEDAAAGGQTRYRGL